MPSKVNWDWLLLLTNDDVRFLGQYQGLRHHVDASYDDSCKRRMTEGQQHFLKSTFTIKGTFICSSHYWSQVKVFNCSINVILVCYIDAVVLDLKHECVCVC